MARCIQAIERSSLSTELLEEQDLIMQGFLDLVSDFNLNVKVVEKHWKEFCVEGEEEDAIIIFIFQKCHSGYSV